MDLLIKSLQEVRDSSGHPYRLGLTVDGDGSQDDPCRPFGQVFDEDEGHEGADQDQVGLLQLERTLPVDTDHPHRPEVPDDHPHCRVVHGQVVSLKHFAGKQEESSAGSKRTRCDLV